MGVMPIIIVLSLLVAGGFAIAFIVGTLNGQYDDVTTPAIRIVFEDESETDASTLGQQLEHGSTTTQETTFINNLHRRL